jgi:hypothetical protein
MEVEAGKWCGVLGLVADHCLYMLLREEQEEDHKRNLSGAECGFYKGTMACDTCLLAFLLS